MHIYPAWRSRLRRQAFTAPDWYDCRMYKKWCPQFGLNRWQGDKAFAASCQLRPAWALSSKAAAGVFLWFEATWCSGFVLGSGVGNLIHGGPVRVQVFGTASRSANNKTVVLNTSPGDPPWLADWETIPKTCTLAGPPWIGFPNSVLDLHVEMQLQVT